MATRVLFSFTIAAIAFGAGSTALGLSLHEKARIQQQSVDPGNARFRLWSADVESIGTRGAVTASETLFDIGTAFASIGVATFSAGIMLAFFRWRNDR